MNNDKNLKIASEKLAQDIVVFMKDDLVKEGKVTSGNLERSLNYNIVEGDSSESVTINITSLGYLKNVDEGRRAGAKQPPSDAILPWVNQKGIKDIGGVPAKPEQVAFVIARSIGEKGIKPTNIISKTKSWVLLNKKDLIEDAARKDMVDKIKLMFNI